MNRQQQASVLDVAVGVPFDFLPSASGVFVFAAFTHVEGCFGIAPLQSGTCFFVDGSAEFSLFANGWSIGDDRIRTPERESINDQVAAGKRGNEGENGGWEKEVGSQGGGREFGVLEGKERALDQRRWLRWLEARSESSGNHDRASCPPTISCLGKLPATHIKPWRSVGCPRHAANRKTPDIPWWDAATSSCR